MMGTRQRVDFDDAASFAHALGHATRLQIVYTLGIGGPQTVKGLCQRLALPQPRVSHHLKILRLTGLVRREQRGNAALYSRVRRPAAGEQVLRILLADGPE